MATRVKDIYGDTLEVEPVDGNVQVTVYEDDQEATAALNEENAVKGADAIYRAAGRNVPPAGAVRASDVSLNEALIRVAAAHKTHVTFRYAKSETAPIEVRTLVPTKVLDKTDHVTFVGVDEDRKGIRSFRSDRIKGIVQVVA